MHHQSHREQSLALEQLLSGPRVGTKDKDREDGDRDGDGTEDVNGKAIDDGDDSRVLKEREKEKEAEEGILKQGAAQVAVLSFARITQVRSILLSCSSPPCLNLSTSLPSSVSLCPVSFLHSSSPSSF